jgi:proteasome lid subunit RPN8/RPN11
MQNYHLEDSPVRPDQFYLRTVPEFFTPALESEFATIAMEHYPNEACAFIINGKLVPVDNVSKNPTEEFELSVDSCNLIIKAQGFIHSHPDGPIIPSELDMITQKSCCIPFGLMTCTSDSASNSIWLHDGTLAIQLEERPFLHGIFDCYSLIRAYYWQSRTIKLPDFPREMDWWEAKDKNKRDDLYLDNFEKANFKEISSLEEMKKVISFL